MCATSPSALPTRKAMINGIGYDSVGGGPSLREPRPGSVSQQCSQDKLPQPLCRRDEPQGRRSHQAAPPIVRLYHRVQRAGLRRLRSDWQHRLLRHCWQLMRTARRCLHQLVAYFSLRSANVPRCWQICRSSSPGHGQGTVWIGNVEFGHGARHTPLNLCHYRLQTQDRFRARSSHNAFIYFRTDDADARKPPRNSCRKTGDKRSTTIREACVSVAPTRPTQV
jgi:hypothetical protein